MPVPRNDGALLGLVTQPPPESFGVIATHGPSTTSPDCAYVAYSCSARCFANWLTGWLCILTHARSIVKDLTVGPTSAPAVSLIMAVRDGQRWLSEAINSILDQTFSDFELLIIDDGSVDGTHDILVQYRAKDARVRVIRQESRGLVDALNRGLALAAAPLTARLDADDVALPQRLQRQVEYFQAHPSVALLGAWAQEIDEESRTQRRHRRPPSGPTLRAMLAQRNPFIHSSVMFRTAVARDLGGYRPAFAAAEDYDLWLRMSEIAGIEILPEVLVQYRLHRGSVTETTALRQIFSARLARVASQARRTTGRDPTEFLSQPPGWHDVPADACYADAARFCQFLELADRAMADVIPPCTISLEPVSKSGADLTAAERKLAQLALFNLIRRRIRVPGYTAASLVALLFRLNPTRAAGLFLRA